MGWPTGVMDRPQEGSDLDKELEYLINTLPEDQTIPKLVAAIPHLSEEGARLLTAALLARYSSQKEPE